MSGALCAAANMTAAPVPPLLAGILFDGSTAAAHFNVDAYTGDTDNRFSAAFAWSASGGSGVYPAGPQYEVTASSSQGYLTDDSHSLFVQHGTTVGTTATLSMGWAIGGLDNLLIGNSESITVRAKVTDDLGTVAYSSSITVSVTRTS